MDPRIEKLAEILVDYSVGVSKGDVVMVGRMMMKDRVTMSMRISAREPRKPGGNMITRTSGSV